MRPLVALVLALVTLTAQAQLEDGRMPMHRFVGMNTIACPTAKEAVDILDAMRDGGPEAAAKVFGANDCIHGSVEARVDGIEASVAMPDGSTHRAFRATARLPDGTEIHFFGLTNQRFAGEYDA